MTRPRVYAIDATPLLGRRTGIGRYAEEVVARVLPRLVAGESLLLHAGTFRMNPLFGTSHEPLRRLAREPNVRVRRLWAPLSAARFVWNRVPFPPVEALTGRIDVYHGTNFHVPPTRRAARVVTVHDLSFLVMPETVPPAVGRRTLRAAAASVARAHLVIADSERTRIDVIERLGAPPERVRTVVLGVGEAYLLPRDAERSRRLVAERHGIDAPYVLFVGTTNPRKNLSRLLAAFAEARRRAALPHSLVLVGDPGFAHGAVLGDIRRLGLEGAVRLPGYVAEEHMPDLYAAAGLLAFPSLYEGFGLPVLEAMGAGCPVLTSTTSCLPEVAGDAAELVDPTSVDALAAGIERVLTDGARRAALVRAGHERARLFSWDRAAEAHLAIYRELAG